MNRRSLLIPLGVFGVLLPIYASVAHRMFPFFASRVVPGYQSWRPMWLLAVQWHPEHVASTDAAQQRLFDELVRAAGARIAGR